MSRRKRDGKCHLCGVNGKLSFEHVPPESAFNNHSVVRATQKDILNIGWNGKHGVILQQGSGAYTLCEKCNSSTGSWYAAEYAHWAHQALNTLSLVDPKEENNFSIRFEGYPLRLLKQAIVMHFSTNSDSFSKFHPELVKFVKDKHCKQFPKKYQIDLVLVRGQFARSTGVYCLWDMERGGMDIASEVAHFPFSFVLRFIDEPNQKPAIGRSGPIEHFSDYGYYERKEVWVQTKAGHITNVNLPADYRSPDKLRRDIEQSKEEEKIRQLANSGWGRRK